MTPWGRVPPAVGQPPMALGCPSPGRSRGSFFGCFFHQFWGLIFKLTTHTGNSRTVPKNLMCSQRVLLPTEKESRLKPAHYPFFLMNT